MEILTKRSFLTKEEIGAFQKETGLDKTVAALLLSRGIDNISKINAFFNPDFKNTIDPFALPGMKDAADRLAQALKNGENIAVYGDYDCDGISAVAMLCLALKKAGANVCYYIPDRHNEGYGINIDSVERLAENFFPDLIVTVDCGITAAEEVRIIEEEMGIDVIVTDHHEPKGELSCCATVNPKLRKTGAEPDLCGAGVALKLIEAVFGSREAENYLDLAAVATVADMVELKGDNRIIAALGIERINKRTARTGLNLLVQKAVGTDKKITASDIAFKIAPRINASGRIASADKAAELFLSDDRSELLHIVSELERDNFERQQLCADVTKHAIEILNARDMSDDYAIVIASPLWDSGVVGIAAAKIAEEYMRPTVLLTTSDGKIYKGSARSIKDIDLFDALSGVQGTLLSFGGHKSAAGVTVEKDGIETFARALSDYIKNKYPINTFIKSVAYDAELSYDDLTVELASKLERFEPFGMCNPKPVFITDMPPAPFLKMKSGDHYRLRIDGKKEMVAFNFKTGIELIKSAERVKLAYSVEKELFQNREYVKGIVKEAVAVTPHVKDDYLCAAVLEQARYPDSAYETVKTLEGIDAKPFGTLYIAFSQQAFDDFSFLCGHGFIGADLKQTNLSRVYLGALSAAKPELYKNIVFLEKPLSGGYIDALKSRLSANIYVLERENALLPLIKADAPSREDIALVFRRLADCKEDLFFEGLSLFYEQLFPDKALSLIKFSACFYILFELKLVMVYNNQKLELKSEKTELDASRTYRYLKSL